VNRLANLSAECIIQRKFSQKLTLRPLWAGGKMAKKKEKDAASLKATDPDVQKMYAAIISDRSDDTIIMFIPSHDASQKPLTNQDVWAHNGLELFSRLYGGATAFTSLRGIWRTEDGTDLLDEPVLIQSLAKREDAEDEAKLGELASFLRRMRHDMNQKCVAVICNDTIHYV
jgi:hypothetical protein